MNKTKVSVVKCANYSEKELKNRLKELLKPYNGMKAFVKPGQKVLLKVNLLMDSPPEAVVTTNPVLVKAVARLVQQAGGKVIIGDSPGGPFRPGLLKRVYQKSGLKKIADEIGAELNFNTGQEKVSYSEGIYNKSFVLGKYVTEADVIINLPKLKTHGLTVMTAAVKNLFGTIPGVLKAEYHVKMPEVEVFSEMLLELAFCVKPALNIVDAVVGMEGDGPSGGDARNFGYIMASRSPLAVDVASANLLGIKPQSKVPYIEAARKRGWVADISKLEIVGQELEPLKGVKVPPAINSSNLIDQRLPEPIANFLENILKPRPVFNHDKCVSCGDCYQSCPADTIIMKNNYPEVELDDCIRCFCCQEMCKYKAVEIKRPILARLLVKINEVKK
ncbi:MAG: DUF362 domain-containing protein [Halothermotrichaceae bacterium]